MNSELLLAEIASLLQAGKKIEAIKIYRQLTGSSLNEAKFALEQIELGIGLAGAMVIQPDVAALIGLGDEGAQSVLLADIAHLLTRGKKIEAIKIYRQYTGLGLADAKNAVDRIERLIHPQGF
ncbi:MAG TPA: ribosomal protein L7/L12 [Ktedonobacteraceae bacterium]